MKKIILFLLCICCILPIQGEQRKKVAIVLSGGGAKGVAHIRALKVIEEAGIPIDYIVGTSMGAIVGGLYSIGYTTAQLDTLVRNQDWKFLLSDATERKEKSLSNRELSEQYILTVPFNKKAKESLTGGVIKGRNLGILFSKLTEGYHDSLDFNTFPIPFACVAYNLVDGKEVVFRNGVLATAIRASMSIPGAFTPVRINDQVLVDGGMANNYPVDVARQMGADYVIGVDVQDSLRNANNLVSLPNIVGQIVNLIVENKYQENIDKSDIHIKVNVSGYSATSFTPNAIDSLLARGETAARKQWDNLIELKHKNLNLSKEFRPGEREEHLVSMSDSIPPIKTIVPEIQDENKLNLGVRFDNEKLASLIFNAQVSLNQDRRSLADLTIRLGQAGYGRLGYTFGINKKQTLQSVLSYQFSYNDVNLYNKGERISNYSFLHHNAEWIFQRNWHDIRCVLGLAFDNYHYNNMLIHPDLQIPTSHSEEYFFNYSFNMFFENFDKRVYPTKGMKWNAGIRFYTTDFWRYKSRTAIPIANFSWEMAFSPNSRFTIYPALYGRCIWKQETPYSLRNSIGGLTFGRYTEQQMPFMGIGYMEMTEQVTVVSALKLQQRIGTNQYVSLTGNFALNSDKLKNIFQKDNFFGCGLTYGYDSFIGPLEGSVFWSDRTNKVGFFVSFGYNF